jgi:hypothetical protein
MQKTPTTIQILQLPSHPHFVCNWVWLTIVTTRMEYTKTNPYDVQVRCLHFRQLNQWKPHEKCITLHLFTLDVTNCTYAQFIIMKNGAWNNYKSNDESKVYWNKFGLGLKHWMEPHIFISFTKPLTLHGTIFTNLIFTTYGMHSMFWEHHIMDL